MPESVIGKADKSVAYRIGPGAEDDVPVAVGDTVGYVLDTSARTLDPRSTGVSVAS
jgi:hypothetical protein